jgi:hypothetical protein
MAHWPLLSARDPISLNATSALLGDTYLASQGLRTLICNSELVLKRETVMHHIGLFQPPASRL